jgi:uridylate kinase
MSSFKETIVIAVGGSLLVPDQVDVSFITKLKNITRFFTEDGYQIALVIGGGKTSRNYHRAATSFENITNEDVDWLGIKAIQLNAELVKRVCSDLDVHPQVVLKPEDIHNVVEPVVVIGAWEPGHSSDYNAVTMAHTLGAQRVINFSNISYVYDKDPNQFDDAQKIPEMSWDQYRALIPEKWSANLSAPFDPVASQMAQELGMTVAILGSSIENLQAYLNSEDFEGSVIR